MPNYDYKCESCGDEREDNIPMAERDKQFCVWCGEPLKRQLTFRGSVWSPTRNGGHS